MRKFLKIFFAISVLTLTFKIDWYYNDYNNQYNIYNINNTGSEENEYYKKLLEEKEKKIKLLEENIEKILEKFYKLDTKDLKSFTLIQIENIFNDFKKILDEDVILKDTNKVIFEKIEEILNEKKDFEVFQKYLNSGNKANIKDFYEWKIFSKNFENMKNNKQKILEQFRIAEKYVKSFDLDKAINTYKNICNSIKLFECEYNIAKIYKTEMIWYSESYHSSNKEENFLKNKQEAIKYLENAINSYKKDLFLDETDISKLEKELEEVKNYTFKWNKQEKNLVKNGEVKKEENKVVKLFFERLEKMTKNYSETQKKNLYSLLIPKLEEFKMKNIPTEIKNSLDEIILKLKQKL